MKFFCLPACVLLCVFFAPSLALAKTVTLTQSDDGSSVSLVVGDMLVVRLKPNMTTGYRWSVSTNDVALLQLKATHYVKTASGKASQSGVQVFTFVAVKPGQTSLSLGYRHSSVKHAAAAKTFSVDVSIASAVTTTVAKVVKPEPPKVDGVLVGKFFGVLPCADCSSINETLLLYAKGSPELVASRYQLQMDYLGARGGNKTMQESGEWTILRGTRDDPDAIVYQLNPEKPAEISNYLLKGDTLMPMDRMQRLIVAPMNLSLRRER